VNVVAQVLTPLETSLIDTLAKRLSGWPQAAEILVFGSRARGASHAESDLDLAIRFNVPRDRELERELASIAADLNEAPHLPPGFCDVVPIFSDEANTPLARSVAREGFVAVRF